MMDRSVTIGWTPELLFINRGTSRFIISACVMKSTRATGMKASGTKAAAMNIGGSRARPGPTNGRGMQIAAIRHIRNR